MKRKITLSIALALSIVFASLMSSNRTALAQQTKKYIADTGVITLTPNQSLRVTVVRSNNSSDSPPLEHIIQFRLIIYTENACNGSICKQTVASVLNSGAIELMPGETSWATFPSGIVRGMVLSNRPDVQVNIIIINNLTGEVTSQI